MWRKCFFDRSNESGRMRVPFTEEKFFGFDCRYLKVNVSSIASVLPAKERVSRSAMLFASFGEEMKLFSA